MKTISVGERLSCMVVEVKGCLGRQRRLFVELYRLEPGAWHGQDGKAVPRCLPMEDSLPSGCRIVGGRRSPCGRRWFPRCILLLYGQWRVGEIGSWGRVREFCDRWIREKHGRWGAFSMWEEGRVCRWREIGPVLFQRVLPFLERAFLIHNGG